MHILPGRPVGKPDQMSPIGAAVPHDDSAWAWVAERNPGGRASTPVDTARLISWLVSDEAEWVTGQVIASDGGWSTLGA